MVGSCPECNGKLSSDASTCPHCGYSQKSAAPATAPPSQPPKAGGGFFDPKKNAKALVRLAIIVGVLLVAVLVVVYMMGGKKSAETVFKKVTRQPITVINETFDVPAKAYQGRGFSVTSGSEVTVEVNVTDGDGVNVYMIDAKDIKEFEKASDSLFGGKFHHYPAFQALKTKQKTMSDRLPAGSYYVVVYNETWGILAKPKFTVHLKVTSL
jgi:hypothetical protein